MHISEGVLAAPVLLGGGVIAVVGTALGLRRIRYDRMMPVAMLTSVFFVASLIHVPLGPGSVHLLLHGLLGLILGWAAFPAILVALFLQALLFQFGGLLVLGVNTAALAGAAVLCWYLFRPLLRVAKLRIVAGFAAGFCAVFFSALFMATALALSDQGFTAAARLIFIAHLPVMVLEGLITSFTVTFLMKVQPEILQMEV